MFTSHFCKTPSENMSNTYSRISLWSDRSGESVVCGRRGTIVLRTDLTGWLLTHPLQNTLLPFPKGSLGCRVPVSHTHRTPATPTQVPLTAYYAHTKKHYSNPGINVCITKHNSRACKQLSPTGVKRGDIYFLGDSAAALQRFKQAIWRHAA